MIVSTLSPAVKAQVLVEALPYIKRFWGKVVVVKYGGNVLTGADDSTALRLFAEDVVLMRSVGMRPVVVHGGGPQIGEMLQRLNIASEFRRGLRVTDAATLEVVRMVLVGKVNREIVSAINMHGPLAVGMSGEDANLLRVTCRDPELGFVGDVEHVNTDVLDRLLTDELIPVIATIGVDGTGQAYNVNADTAAGSIAGALNAEKLVGRMEGGDLSLEESLSAHKRGLELARFCQDRLESAQQQVRVLEGEVLKTLSAAQSPDASDD